MKNSYADLRRLIVSTRPSKLLLSFAGLFAAAEIVATLWFPILTRDLVDFLGEGEQFGSLLWILLSVLVCLAIAGGISRYLLAKAGQAVVKTLRARIAAKLAHQPIRFFDEQASGELASRVVNDSAVISTLVPSVQPTPAKPRSKETISLKFAGALMPETLKMNTTTTAIAAA